MKVGRPRARKSLMALGLLLSVLLVSISGCAPRDGNGFLAQTRCQQLGNTPLANGSELMMVVNHIRARLGLPNFVGSWEFARDAYYLGMCLDLLTSDAIAFIERYERALVKSVTTPEASPARKTLLIDAAITPTSPTATPRRAVAELMTDDRPLTIEIVVSMLTGITLLGVLFALPYTLPRMEQINERKKVLARMKAREFTPREHGESGEHTFMSLGRPIDCLWDHATRAAILILIGVLFLLWSDNVSAETDMMFICCVAYPLLAIGYATIQFVSSSERFITNHRVIPSTTFFFPREDIYSDFVSGLEVQRSPLGMIFGYGTLKISIGDEVIEMPYVKDAKQVQATWEKMTS
jgi:hypothetical protein